MFAALTRLAPDPAGASAAVVDEQLESLRRRWNQHGIEAVIGAADDLGGVVVVRYRLSVAAGHAEPSVVHAAFRDDLDRALAAVTDRSQPPDAWDLASLAAAAATDHPSRPRTTREYEVDTTDD